MPANRRRIVNPSDSVRHLAVAACRTEHGTHVGIVYREGTERKLLHFAFHHCLVEQDFKKFRHRYVSVEPALTDPELIAFAGLCREIYRQFQAHQRMPYNLQNDQSGFDPSTLDFVMPMGSTGISCATFVLKTFSSPGPPVGVWLLDASGWQASRPGDREMQEYYVKTLRNMPDSTGGPAYAADCRAQADRIESEIGCPRIRPEEVAGACLEDELPATFRQCERNGRLILKELDWRSGASGSNWAFWISLSVFVLVLILFAMLFGDLQGISIAAGLTASCGSFLATRLVYRMLQKRWMRRYYPDQ
jgi:hypothetical protein